MSLEEEEEKPYKLALANLKLLKSQFLRKINELKAIRHSILDALSRYQATEEDYQKLKTELEHLAKIRQEYEESGNAFNVNYGWKYSQEAADINRSVEDCLNACFDITVNVDIVMRKVRSQLNGEVTNVANDLIKDETETSEEESETEDNHLDGNEPEEKSTKRMSSKLMVTICLLIVITFYSSLAIVINFVQDNRAKPEENLSTRRKVEQDNTTCGADSFMLRDGVCDETANIAKCLFDGGDCCKENKDRGLCRDCKCVLDIDQEELKKRFQELEVKPIQDLDYIQTAVGITGWTVEVEDVVSLPVCTVLCLDHKINEELNAWQYRSNERLCNCGWVESTNCPEKMVIGNWTWNSEGDSIVDAIMDYRAFVQINKTVPCDCLIDGLLLIGEKSVLAKVDYGDMSPSVHSLWHCQELCRGYKDCVWVSWKSSTIKNEKTSVGECRMMMDLPDNAKVSTHSIVDLDWTSSSTNCTRVEGHFERYSSKGDHYHFICPSNKTSQNHNHQPIIPTMPGEDQPSFLLYVDGWTQSSIVVLKVDMDNVIECAHSISPPENMLVDAIGGVLTAPNSDEPMAVICGGEYGSEQSGSYTNHDKCLMLTEDKTSTSRMDGMPLGLSAGGILNSDRVGSASTVINNGSALWITGGVYGLFARKDSELVGISNSNENSAIHNDGLPNGPGPDLPEHVSHHCFQKVGPQIAIVVGGLNGHIEPWVSTWSMNVSAMAWKIEADLNLQRLRHACGVLTVGNDKMVVAAGGFDFQNDILGSVELLWASENHNDGLHFGQHWELGPSLPTPLADAASAATADQQALFIIGGARVYDKSNLVLRFHCSGKGGHQCFWTKVDLELKAPSAMGLALAMPDIPMLSRKYSDARECREVILDDDSLLILTTGWKEMDEIGDTETFVVPAFYNNNTQNIVRCQPPPHQTQSMYALSSASGGLLKVENSGFMPIVCGGSMFGKEDRDKCYHLDKEQSGVSSVVGHMRERRQGAASVSILNGTALWVTGGSYGYTSDTTSEWIDVSMALSALSTDKTTVGTLSEGPGLPASLAYHCLEMISSKTVLIYGGTDWHESKFLATAWSMDNLDQTIGDHFWIPRAPMSLGRFRHMCGVIRDDIGSNSTGRFVVAAGGADAPASITNRVELLHIDDSVSESWQEGPPLPINLLGAASATTDDQAILFVAGGAFAYEDFLDANSFSVNDNFFESKAIFSLRCLASFCWWERESTELIFTRIQGVALIMPPTITKDTAYVAQCKRPLIADGHCHTLNNNIKCGYDGGDCCLGQSVHCSDCYADWCNCHETGVRHCDPTETSCDSSGLDDGWCDSVNNNPKCMFDGGDCCSGEDFWCSHCDGDSCNCHETGEPLCYDPLQYECETSTIGDYVCDSSNNNQYCEFDGGDCCTGDDIWCSNCDGDSCNCHETGESKCIDPTQCLPAWLGDGLCDPEFNNPYCEFDGGDCCSGEDLWCSLCDGDSCNCHETGEPACAGPCNKVLASSGVCEGTNNLEVCNYDGGDCCQEATNATNFCTSCTVFGIDRCSCHVTGLEHCVHREVVADRGNCHLCLFPFVYQGTAYYDCTDINHSVHWCSTSTDVYHHIEGK